MRFNKNESPSKAINVFLPCLIASIFSGCIFLFIHGGSETSSSLLPHQIRQQSTLPVSARGSPPTALDFPLWWAAPFYSTSGYGVEATKYVTGLLQFGLIRREDLWLTQSGDYVSRRRAKSREVTDLLESVDYRNQVKVLSPPELDRSAIAICHTYPDLWLQPNETYPQLDGTPCPSQEMMDKCLYRIGRTMTDTDRLPKLMVKHALLFDEIWVPSEFSRQTFAASGVNTDNIYLLPESINLTLYDPMRHKAMSIKAIPHVRQVTGHIDPPEAYEDDMRSFIFFSVFNWEGRKGWDILLKAFLEEFKAEEKVELHIVTHSFMERVNDWTAKVRQGILDRCNLTQLLGFDVMPKILIIEDFMIDDIYYPMMAMGLPVISTNWNGATAFLNEHNGYPIEVESIVAKAEADGNSFGEFSARTLWAQPSLKHLKQLMRHVFENREEARAKGAAARLYLEENFSPEAVAQGLKKLILAAEGRAKDKMSKRLP